jgi:hypothetical protein
MSHKTIVLQKSGHALNLAPGFSRAGKVTVADYAWDSLRRRDRYWKLLYKLAWQLLTSKIPERRLKGSKTSHDSNLTTVANDTVAEMMGA